MYFKKDELSYIANLVSPTNNLHFLHMIPSCCVLGVPRFCLQGGMLELFGREGKGKWSVEQQRVYLRFLQQNIEEMSCAVSRKVKKVFLKMSREVKTRSADQCRSHHQKILQYHDSVEDIIRTSRQRFCKGEFENKEPAYAKTTLDLFESQGFYQLQLQHNKFAIIINQSAIQFYPH